MNSCTPGATKHDSAKLRLDLMPPEAIEAVVRILEFGAKKYGDYNWQKGITFTRLYAACLRHLFAWRKGETLDPESGQPHVAHAACNLVFMLYFMATAPENDNRAVKS